MLGSLVVAAGCVVDATGIPSAEPTESKSVMAPDAGTDARPSVDLGADVGLDLGMGASSDAGADTLAAADVVDVEAAVADRPAVEAASATPRDPPSPKPPLLLLLPLDDPDGSMAARDRSGLQQQVTLHRLNAERCWVEGRRGGALALQRNGYLRVAVRGALATLTSFSFATWIRRERSDDDGVLISRGVAGTGGYSYRLWLDGDRLRVQLNDPGPRSGFHETSRGILPVRRWVHVVLTFDNPRVRLYQDGALSDEWSYDHPLVPVSLDHPLLIGASESPTDDEGVRDRLTARLDEVALYGAALDPAQVAALAGKD